MATVGVQQQVLSYLDRWFKSLQGLMNDDAATASRPCGLGGRGSRGASVLTRGGHVLSLSACLRLAFSNLFPTRPSGGFLYRRRARLPGPPLNPPPWILSAAGFRAGTSARRSGPWADAGSAAPAHLSPPRRACSCTPPQFLTSAPLQMGLLLSECASLSCPQSNLYLFLKILLSPRVAFPEPPPSQQ